MLAAVFSFRGRLNRLQYFGGLVGLLLSFVVAAIAAVLCLGDLTALRAGACKAVAGPDHRADRPSGLGLGSASHCRPGGLAIFGLNPLFVIPAYILFQALDQALATSMAGAPVASLSSVASMMPHHTVLEPVVDLAYSLGLLFWPGRAKDGGQAPRSGPTTCSCRALPLSPPKPLAPMAARIAAVAAPAQPAGPIPFGRRGL